MARDREPRAQAGAVAGAAPAGLRRLAARLHFALVDHGALRLIWTNLHRVADGVWRSNHPGGARIERYRRMGIRTVLSLRGEGAGSQHLFEEEACRRAGLTLVRVRLESRRLVRRERLLTLLDLFEEVERPFVMHCKSGADRTGLAAALYLLHVEGAPLAVARRELGLKYLHRRRSAAGVLDQVLDAYAADTRAAPMPIRDWIAERYDPAAITARFAAGRRRRGR